ncbi:MAG TPA: ATP phosphoribosyltransferase [Planctomycetaceae bacterium]|nr:ATP phosphoribosyltransferase [Rhodopirellula sp.]MCH2362517.1 ATP phosphoribosyltransferase [Pirellulales bacterium]HCK72347.1 ATP phosphoribosyltransferase [Planctomycetaceae bacterium]HCP85161.1 ATP phosphoribosyltransferase [Planctomycetaceae bacterium]|tara:strand:+ start:5448 stop:6299 length:852 start_codon:yes stop_codon:yes gene_type:complete
MTNLRIGLPSKGRLAEVSEQLLKKAGLKFRRQNRSLFARVSDMPVDIIFLRTDDIPVLCAEGALDMGITGSDLVAEADVDLDERLQLGVGKCRLAICVPDDGDFNDAASLDGQRIATSFPTVTRKYLGQHGAEAHLVKLTGSVEIMISLGIADAIVDLVETGSTLAANRLRILDEIGNYQTILVQNKERRHADLADRIVRRLQGVVIAQGYSLLEYNIPREKLAQAEEITPGYNSPTINPLEDNDWCAVRVMVKSSQVSTVMDQLDELGASAILETQINNCRL